jgi:ATP-dependent exoDNAse (exonuclease V) beta subunit
VVWWDPAALPRAPDENFGLRQEVVLSDQDPAAEQEGIARWEAWQASRNQRLELGRRKTRDVVVVTELAEGPALFEARLRFETTARDARRPAGRRFGTLVHTLMRDLPLDASAAEIARLAELHRALLDATTEETAAAVVAATRALAHPLFERARSAAASGRCFREPPFVLALSDGRLLEGTIDLAFAEDGHWTVVDYKTDADVAASRERYEVQLAWYLYALEKLKGAPAEGVLLAV